MDPLPVSVGPAHVRPPGRRKALRRPLASAASLETGGDFKLGPMYSDWRDAGPAAGRPGWWLAQGQPPRWGQLLGFLAGGVLAAGPGINPGQYGFDADIRPRVDPRASPSLSGGEPHGRRDRAWALAWPNGCWLAGLGLMRPGGRPQSSPAGARSWCWLAAHRLRLPRVVTAALTYRGLGNRFCWLAFGPLATAGPARVGARTRLTGRKPAPFLPGVDACRQRIALAEGPSDRHPGLVLYLLPISNQVDEDAPWQALTRWSARHRPQPPAWCPGSAP